MHEWQPISALNDAKDKLPSDTSRFLVHPVGADVIFNPCLAMNAHRGQVVKDHRELLVQQGPHLLGHEVLNRFAVVHEGIHRAKEMVVRNRIGHIGNRHRFQPFEAPKLGVRGAKTVENHGTD